VVRLYTYPFAILLLASTAFAQSPSAQPSHRVFNFSNKPVPQAAQQISTILSTVCDIEHVSIGPVAGPSASTLVVDGTPDQLALTAWLVNELDQPAAMRPGASACAVPSDQFPVNGNNGDVVRVFHLSNTAARPPLAIQEVLTMLRTVGDDAKVGAYSPLSVVVVRGSPAQIALAKYLIGEVDAPDGPSPASPDFPYKASDGASQIARVFHLAHTSSPLAIMDVLAALVVVADIQKISTISPARALAVRGTASDIAASEWLIQSLDIPAVSGTGTSPNTRQFQMPSATGDASVIAVFYPVNITTSAQFQILGQIRNQLKVGKAFSLVSPAALIIRGSPGQIAASARLIQNRTISTARTMP
jgi:type II secretory pathway component GspD/PulD (secretin)